MFTKARTWLGVAMLAIFPILADVCGLDLPKWLRFGLFHAFSVSVVMLILAIVASYLQDVGWIKQSTARRSTMFVSIVGAIIGAIIAPWVWNSIRPDDIDIAQTLGANAKGDTASPPQTQSDDLDFYFHSFFASASSKYLQYGETTVTNRSPRDMHLELWAHIDYFKDNGEPARHGFQPEWNPQELDENTGQTFIDLEPYETKKGRLVLFLPKPGDEHGVAKWKLDMSRNTYIHAFDTVTGKHIAFKAMSGYPIDKMPWPLPSHKKLLALEFPELAASGSQDLPALETLDLLLRTNGHMYNDSGVSVPVTFTNRSANRMELKINLLNRRSPDENAWQSFEGAINKSRGTGSPDQRTLIIEPNETTDGSLAFANTGFTNAGDQLSENPKVTLLEISDLVSGKKVWCAIYPGYPPGTDMRSATVVENPPANSGNQPSKPTNDPQ